MDARKEYVAPAIAAEDVLEQTSLACNLTAVVLGDPEECPTQANYLKGANWNDWWECASAVLEGPAPLCFPEVAGVVLS